MTPTWKKVTAPKSWNPKTPGAELVGYYGGTTERRSPYGGGSYSVVLVHTKTRGSFMVSGVRVLQLIDASCVEPGDPVRIVFQGWKDLGPAPEGNRQKQMKLFDVYVASGGDIPLPTEEAVEE